MYLDQKGPSVKDHRIVAKSSTMAVGYDEWPLSNTLWMKCHNNHGKYKTELNE